MNIKIISAAIALSAMLWSPAFAGNHTLQIKGSMSYDHNGVWIPKPYTSLISFNIPGTGDVPLPSVPFAWYSLTSASFSSAVWSDFGFSAPFTIDTSDATWGALSNIRFYGQTFELYAFATDVSGKQSKYWLVTTFDDDMTDRSLADIFTGYGHTSFQEGGLEVYGTNLENVSYSGLVSITPIAVPEPQSWMTLLAGVGLLCGLLRRQRLLAAA